MKVTGYKLRDALRRWQLRRDTAAAQFPKTLSKFESDDKPTPQAVAETVIKAEAAIAKLQVVQARYNVAVTVETPNGRQPLIACVKSVGGLARVEKMWRTAAGTEKDRRSIFGGDMGVRDKDHEVAKRTVTVEDAATLAEGIGRRLSALREAIATGNATEIAIEDLDPTLFE